MAKLIHEWWFKWVVIAVMLLTTAAIFGSGIWKEYKRQQAVIEAKVAEYRAMREYEDRFQSWMTRIYQNLRLDHFLAAYQNARKMPRPRADDAPRVEEFITALQRIFSGLLEANLIRESEEILEIIRELAPNSTTATDAFTAVESKKRFDLARRYLKDAEVSLELKNYRGAVSDLQKADIELNAVIMADMAPVLLEKDRRASLFRIARFHVLIDEASRALAKAQSEFAAKRFETMQKAMSESSRKVGIAAFYDNESPEVRRIRDGLHDLAADLAVEIPNSMPLWNKWSREHAGRSEDFFYLVDYHFDLSKVSEHVVRIGFDYLRHRDEKEYVVRYRIYFDDGSSYFNGHFLGPVKSKTLDTEMSSIVFEQALPEQFHKQKIRRVELTIYNTDSLLLSRVMRAFRES
jgi:hypothetical protein